LAAPETDVFRSDFDKHDLYVTCGHIEFTDLLHHGSVKLSLCLEGATLEENNRAMRETG
jgi:hypothetical protein